MLSLARLLAASIIVAVLSAPLPSTATALAQSATPTPPPGADVGRTEDQVVLSGTVSVPRGRSVGEVVVFHGRAIVAGVVVGDVVVLDGPIVISGQVSGAVVALNGPIRLGAAASVGGDVMSAQEVRLEPGALVRGDVQQDVPFTPRGAFRALGVLLGGIAIAVSTLLLLLFLLAIAPKALERVATAGRTAPFASAGWGIVIAIAIPVGTVALLASILGFPLGLAVLLGLGLILLVGYGLAVFVVGRLVVREPRSRVGALFAGWGVAAAIGLVPFLNVLVWAIGSILGLGALTVALWRARGGTLPRGRHRAGYAPARVHASADASTVPSGE